MLQYDAMQHMKPSESNYVHKLLQKQRKTVQRNCKVKMHEHFACLLPYITTSLHRQHADAVNTLQQTCTCIQSVLNGLQWFIHQLAISCMTDNHTVTHHQSYASTWAPHRRVRVSTYSASAMLFCSGSGIADVTCGMEFGVGTFWRGHKSRVSA